MPESLPTYTSALKRAIGPLNQKCWAGGLTWRIFASFNDNGPGIHDRNLVVGGVFLNLIPFLGLIPASLLPVAAGLLEFSTVGTFLAIVGTIIALHIATSRFLVQKIMGSRVNIGPVAATLGVLFWGW